MEPKNDPFDNQLSLTDIASLNATAKRTASKDTKNLRDVAKPPAQSSAGSTIIINPVYRPQNMQESADSTAVMTFGRMNPPTIGHEKLIRKVEDVAKDHRAAAHIFASHSEKTAKNPLPQKAKLKYLSKVAGPDTHVTGSSKEAPTILDAAAKLHTAGHKHLVVVAGDDRVDEYHTLLHKYNGVQAKHGHYNFKSIKVESAGHRDPDAEGAEGMSGTKMRAHARSGDMDKFKSGLPKSLHDHAEEIATHIRSVQESFEDGGDGLKKRHALLEKAIKSGIKYSTLEEVYQRGANAWESAESSKTSDQFAFDRVNSFIACGAAYRLDSDLHEIDEVVDMQARVKRRVTMAMHRRKIERAREIAMRRFARNKNLRARALKIARSGLRKRLGGSRGAEYSSLSTAQKITVDKLLDKRQKQVKNIANKIINRVKRDEVSRLSGKRTSTARNVIVASYEPKALSAIVNEATYQGKKVTLNKPSAGDVKKSKVFVDPDGDGKAKKVNFGDKNMTIKKNIPARRASFRARHNCDDPGPKDKARYWSCKAW